MQTLLISILCFVVGATVSIYTTKYHKLSLYEFITTYTHVSNSESTVAGTITSINASLMGITPIVKGDSNNNYNLQFVLSPKTVYTQVIRHTERNIIVDSTHGAVPASDFHVGDTVYVFFNRNNVTEGIHAEAVKRVVIHES